MRVPILILSCVVAACVIGCGRERVAQQEAGIAQSTEPAAGVSDEQAVGESAGEEVAEAAPRSTPAGDQPPCDVEQFALDGYEVKVSGYADLDGDGTDECLIGCQFTQVDDIGEPQEEAYFTLAQWDGNAWAEWFGVPAPGDERYVDEDSIVAAEDLNGDGIVELALQFYGFGVSSRPETLYVWQVRDEALEAAIERESVETSSDDGLLLQDLDGKWPGQEITFAIAQMGDEAHAAPHKYKIVQYAWSNGLYRRVAATMPPTKFAGYGKALEAYVARKGG